jgi:hypothetical protein
MGIIVDGAWALAAWRRGTVPAPLATQGSAFTLPHRLSQFFKTDHAAAGKSTRLRVLPADED